MERLDQLNEGGFDLITSSFAFHYVQDFSALLAKIHAKLKPNGQLIFSQEHPIVTCYQGGERWEKDAQKRQLAYRLNFYRDEGERQRSWFKQPFTTYHRTTATIINNLQQIVARTVSPFESAVLSVTHIEVGNTWNVLPASGFFEGTIRTFEPKVREDVIARFEKVVQATADQFGAQVDITWGNSPYVTYNDQTLTPLIFENSKACRARGSRRMLRSSATVKTNMAGCAMV